jgi:hypothetical protein
VFTNIVTYVLAGVRFMPSAAAAATNAAPGSPYFMMGMSVRLCMLM